MSTNRKTTKQLVPVNYFDESSSEDEGDDKKTKVPKIKLKELNNNSDQKSNKPITTLTPRTPRIMMMELEMRKEMLLTES